MERGGGIHINDPAAVPVVTGKPTTPLIRILGRIRRTLIKLNDYVCSP